MISTGGRHGMTMSLKLGLLQVVFQAPTTGGMAVGISSSSSTVAATH